jgi:transposase-like protein
MSVDECTSPIERLTAEGLIPVASAARKLGVHPASVRRWCETGGQSRSGERVALEHIRTPGRLRTSMAAVERFLSQLGQQPNTEQPARQRTPAKRAKADANARETLRRMGV